MITSDIQRLTVGAIWVGYEVTVKDGPSYRFSTTQDTNGGSVMWKDYLYNPWPCASEGFSRGVGEAMPRPTLTMANLGGFLSSLILLHDGFCNAKVIRYRTLEKYLGGHSNQNFGAHFPTETYFVNRVITETHEAVQFELVTPFDLEDVYLPRRQILVDTCPFEYRKDLCGWTGRMFNALDAPTDDPALDECSHTVRGCQIRFGDQLRFGGFPSARVQQG